MENTRFWVVVTLKRIVSPQSSAYARAEIHQKRVETEQKLTSGDQQTAETEVEIIVFDTKNWDLLSPFNRIPIF
jgi:hypothetical protein